MSSPLFCASNGLSWADITATASAPTLVNVFAEQRLCPARMMIAKRCAYIAIPCLFFGSSSLSSKLIAVYVATEEMVGVDCEALASAVWTMAAGVTVCCASFKDNESLPSLEPLSPLQAGSDGQTRCWGRWGGSAFIFVIFLFVVALCLFKRYFLHTSLCEFTAFCLSFWWLVCHIQGRSHSLTFLPSR